jgi:hypothetical protein
LFVLFLTILVAGTAYGQAPSMNGKFICSDRATSSTPLQIYDSSKGEWCPGALIEDTDIEIRAAAAAAGTMLLSTQELTVVDGDQLGCINFQAPLESSGTDAILVGAGICAESSATFSATVNTTDLVFKNGVSEAAAETVRILANGLIVPVSVTADPCAGTVDVGAMFYNSTSNYMCFCNGAGADIKMNDNTTACF